MKIYPPTIRYYRIAFSHPAVTYFQSSQQDLLSVISTGPTFSHLNRTYFQSSQQDLLSVIPTGPTFSHPNRTYFQSSQQDLLSVIPTGHGGALVEPITLNRRVVGSTPALAAM